MCCGCGGGAYYCEAYAYSSVTDSTYVYEEKTYVTTTSEPMSDEEAAAAAGIMGAFLSVWLFFACLPCIVFWTVLTTILVSCGVCCKCCCCYGCCNPDKLKKKKEK